MFGDFNFELRRLTSWAETDMFRISGRVNVSSLHFLHHPPLVLVMSITDIAYRLLLTVISLIVFMTFKIFSYTFEYQSQWKRSVSPGSSVEAKSLTVCKETQHKVGDIDELRFY